MTISSTTVKVSYSGNGSTTVFAYTFKILDDDEIQVIIRSSTGTETVKTKTTHYTVSGVGSAGGGNITFLTAPTSTQTVVLRRLTTQTQETDYIANDPFPADSHEDALDRITMVAQEIQEELGRAIKLSKTNTITSTEFTVDATDRANKILAFDTNGEISVTQELGTYQGNWATATTYYARDIIKDTSNNNIYIANTAHTSTGSQPISTNADVAKWDLLVDAASASTSANSAANSASNSSNFANNSSNSANTAANHASNSSNFANNSSNSANSSATYLSGVAANAANASNFANNSSNSANASALSASNSSNFANNSSNSANTSSNHASNSSNFANSSSNFANTSEVYSLTAANHSANSSNFANNSSNSANTSANHASNSSNHASNSSNHSSNSSNFANTSSNHSANSSNFANNSSNHSSNASNAANSANSARDAALAAADNFDDVYLGAKATAPTLDNDGDPLTAGDLYYNTVSSTLQVYSGSAWQTAAVSTAGFATLTGVETLTNKTLTTPVISSISNTGTLTLPTSTDTLVGRATTDTLTNKTLTLPTIDNIKIGYSTTATAAGTTTLTSASNYKQYFTGTTTQTIVLPVASTLTVGQTFEIHNNSTGSITVNSSGSNLVGTVQANVTAQCTCILASGTTAASWDFDVTGFTSVVPTTRGGTGLTAIGTSLQTLRVNSGATALEFATASAGFNGSTTTSSAVDITLTSASTQVQFVSMTAADKGVILPNATTLTTKGSPIFQIVNNGTFPFFTKNNDGFNLTQVQPGGSATLTLVDNSTSNGIFSISSIPTSNQGSTYPITSLINLAYSTPQTVKSGISGSSTNLGTTTPWNWGVSASKLSSTSAIIFYVAGTSNRDVYGVVVSYSGTTITVNSETLLYNGSSSAALCFAGVALDASTGLIVVTRAANKICVPFTISGTTISVGTSSPTFGTSTTSRGVTSEIVAASSTLACFLDQSVADGLNYKLRTIQHNGASAPTISSQSSGTITVLDATPSISVISATKVFIAYSGGAAEYTIARIGTLSGTSTPVLETANTTSTTSTNSLSYVPFIKQISSTEFITVGIVGSDNYTVSGTTVTYVSSALYKSRNMQSVDYYNMNMVFLGDFAATTIYNVNYLQTLKRDSDAYHVIGTVDFPKYISYVGSGTSSYNVALDSTTALVVTNNAAFTNAYSPVSAYLLKYIGS